MTYDTKAKMPTKKLDKVIAHDKVTNCWKNCHI